MDFHVHNVPGRIRFKIPGFRDSEPLILTLPRLLQARPGVHKVDVRLSSNSLIVHYDPTQLDQRSIAAFVAATVRRLAAGTEDAAKAARRPRESASPRNTDAQPGHGALYATARHFGIVFGQAAFKAALEQAVRGGLNALYHSSLPRG